jgi:hypothetical protein
MTRDTSTRDGIGSRTRRRPDGNAFLVKRLLRVQSSVSIGARPSPTDSAGSRIGEAAREPGSHAVCAMAAHFHSFAGHWLRCTSRCAPIYGSRESQYSNLPSKDARASMDGSGHPIQEFAPRPRQDQHAIVV